MTPEQNPPLLIKQLVKFMWKGKVITARCFAKEETNMLVVIKGEQQLVRIGKKEVLEYIDRNKELNKY
jgi:hypothetical protein